LLVWTRVSEASIEPMAVPRDGAKENERQNQAEYLISESEHCFLPAGREPRGLLNCKKIIRGPDSRRDKRPLRGVDREGGRDIHFLR
jgi:hypothetical protein